MCIFMTRWACYSAPCSVSCGWLQELPRQVARCSHPLLLSFLRFSKVKGAVGILAAAPSGWPALKSSHHHRKRVLQRPVTAELHHLFHRPLKALLAVTWTAPGAPMEEKELLVVFTFEYICPSHGLTPPPFAKAIWKGQLCHESLVKRQSKLYGHYFNPFQRWLQCMLRRETYLLQSASLLLLVLRFFV